MPQLLPNTWFWHSLVLVLVLSVAVLVLVLERTLMNEPILGYRTFD